MDRDVSRTKKSRNIPLNKSASFSGSPISERFEFKQLFRSRDGDTVVRQYSYEVTGRRKPHPQTQLHRYTKPTVAKSKPIVNSTDYYNTPYEGGIKEEIPKVNFGFPFQHLFHFAKHVSEEKGFANSLAENVPMEVDTSISSDKSIDVNLKDGKTTMTDVHQDGGGEHKNKVPKLMLKPTKPIDLIKSTETNKLSKNKPTSKMCLRLFKMTFFLFIPVVFGVIFLYFNSDFIEPLDSEPIIKNIDKLLYGQDEVINKLEYSLTIMRNKKIFIFTGGVGVGKTYAAKLIERKYPFKNNIQKYILNSKEQYKTLEKEITNNIVKNAHNLIIMDDLFMEDIYLILPVINTLCLSDNKFILIIIFNLQHNSIDVMSTQLIKEKTNEITNIFNHNNIKHMVFMFENLNEDDTKECIKFAMLQRGMEIIDKNVNEVLENIHYKHSGCKGVYRKVQLLRYNNLTKTHILI